MLEKNINARRVPILSSNMKLIFGPGVDISTMLPSVLKFGLILTG